MRTPTTRKRKSRTALLSTSSSKRRRTKTKYEVEQLLDVRYTPTPEYLVKWKGYPDCANEWKKIDDLDCPVLIAEFHKPKSIIQS
jgi:hypothetical protein